MSAKANYRQSLKKVKKLKKKKEKGNWLYEKNVTRKISLMLTERNLLFFSRKFGNKQKIFIWKGIQN